MVSNNLQCNFHWIGEIWLSSNEDWTLALVMYKHSPLYFSQFFYVSERTIEDGRLQQHVLVGVVAWHWTMAELKSLGFSLSQRSLSRRRNDKFPSHHHLIQGTILRTVRYLTNCNCFFWSELGSETREDFEDQVSRSTISSQPWANRYLPSKYRCKQFECFCAAPKASRHCNMQQNVLHRQPQINHWIFPQTVECTLTGVGRLQFYSPGPLSQMSQASTNHTVP